jgi:sugar O-acyltransferase (sialic acid O-acetyltransferase NeuD family)
MGTGSRNILLIGSSGHARVVIDIVEKENRYNIIGLIDTFRNVGETTLGYAVLGSDANIPDLAGKNNITGFLVTIGDNSVREKAVTNIRKICPHIPFVSAIHPGADIGKEVSIGCGTVIMAGAVVNPCCSVGEFCIINTNASLDHDSRMGNFSSLAPRVATGGNCSIGNFTAVGIGAVLRHGISIGDNTVIGAGSVVMHNLGDFSVSYGIPARKIRERSHGSEYL